MSKIVGSNSSHGGSSSSSSSSTAGLKHVLEDKSFTSPKQCGMCGDMIFGFGKNKRCTGSIVVSCAFVARLSSRCFVDSYCVIWFLF